jgi:hypothetical protein
MRKTIVKLDKGNWAEKGAEKNRDRQSEVSTVNVKHFVSVAPLSAAFTQATSPLLNQLNASFNPFHNEANKREVLLTNRNLLFSLFFLSYFQVPFSELIFTFTFFFIDSGNNHALCYQTKR